MREGIPFRRITSKVTRVDGPDGKIAGAKVEAPLADMFWGDRYGKLVDPSGHSWSLATHKEDVPPEEMKKRAQQALAKMGQHAQPVG